MCYSMLTVRELVVAVIIVPVHTGHEAILSQDDYSLNLQ